jgi:mono/diheme cytochrome c family protein
MAQILLEEYMPDSVQLCCIQALYTKTAGSIVGFCMRRKRPLAMSLIIATMAMISPPEMGRAQSADETAASTAFRQYCIGCHNAKLKTAGVVIDPAAVGHAGENAELWERVVRQLRSQAMPPAGMPRPDIATYKTVTSYLEKTLDNAAAAHPNPGELTHLHRLTRTEYQNAIRDLIALQNLPKEMDYDELLPADNSASGFDNLADLLFVSPVIMQRYLNAATKISRLAVGDLKMPEMVNIIRTPQQTPQDLAVEDLPEGTRGGVAIRTYFPLDAEYLVHIETAGGSREQHQMEISVDGERMKMVPVGGGRRGGAPPTEVRIPVKAGPRLIAVTFVQRTEALDETTLRLSTRTRGPLPAVGTVTIRGPFNPMGPGNTPSRERIFVCHPDSTAVETPCAKQILSTMVRRGYRRPATDTDLGDLMPFYEAGRKEAGFDFGIQKALERLLVSPQFLYRIERDPDNTKPGTPYRIYDIELASRLSFFLWSSIPDDELLDLAARGKLHEPEVLEAQTRRMLADSRSDSLVNNFAAQWLFLRDVEKKDPDLFLFRDFDGVLREAFERETGLFVSSIMRENRSVIDLLTANYTFVNERLAKHYGIPNVRGSEFRRVTFPEGSPRGGLLTQGSILTLTSYSTRTSPVLRGKYVLENLLASPPPPPPPDVPALKTEGNPGQKLSMREAMEKHRAAPACASCHARMDPIGFAMENFDAIGQWRDHDAGIPINVSGVLPNGAKIEGVDGLKKALVQDPEMFVNALTGKLLMYAIGRNTQYYDAPAIRAIVRKSAETGYTFSSLVLGIVNSVPFQMRVFSPEQQQAPGTTKSSAH